jgi:hypothetical protein
VSIPLSPGAVALVATVLLALVSVGGSAGADGPALTADYDCGPLLTDEQAEDAMGTSIAVGETQVSFPGPRSYACTWTSGGKSVGKVLAISVRDLSLKANRVDRKRTICKLPGMTQKTRDRVCDLADELEDVRTGGDAFRLYARLIRAVNAGANADRLAIAGQNAVLVDGVLGGAIAMVRPGWTIVYVNCHNLKTSQLDRRCTLQALKRALKNIREQQGESLDCVGDETGSSCQPRFVQPVSRRKG